MVAVAEEQLTIRLDAPQTTITARDAATRWARCIPLLLLTGVTALAGVLVAFAIGACVVVTGRRPSGLTGFQTWTVRVRARSFSWFFLLREDRPSVAAIGLVDEGDDPHVEVTTRPSPELARWEPFVRLPLAVPYLIIGGAFGLVLDLGYPMMLVVAAIRGRWPGWYRSIVVRTEPWAAHGFLYMYLATDARPPFAPLA